MITTPEPSLDDTELLTRARTGDGAAIGELYELHRNAAHRLAVLLVGFDDADDLLADAFARVVARFTVGGGPTSNFHGYLFTTMRNRHRDLRRRGGHEEPASDHPWLLDAAIAPLEDPAEDFDAELAAAALASLPDAWQQVIRLLEVEERSIAETAALMGLQPAAVSSLAYRGREGLRAAYLDQFVRREPGQTSECHWVRERLGRYVRSTLSSPVSCRVDAHLSSCATCPPLLADLEQVNRRLRFFRLQGSRPIRRLRTATVVAGVVPQVDEGASIAG
ncbi:MULTISPECIES: sigma-70 family RNA polymerase sigma factor [unclassified Nocardioides]|uniref:sigma-70 family RNA polymerase sigma factor n=1 Tax=unclassified Nocardioides TaxID=2615069 RepID=UPI0006F81836|nr:MULTISPECIES: sigma-70 family RNA polymerase sigma factor [unclassified Nocardioides]KRA39213.1 hypothetical protein ASD81_11880 [Nocardioides sp. Root614]KRA93172.1 hypothetical protein ASD84_12145 [Nocardioides sp. Root682]